MRAVSSRGRGGLVTWSAAPASRARTASSSSSRAVTMMMGTVGMVALMRRKTARPWASAVSMSRRMSDGTAAAATPTPSSPSAATTTSNPSTDSVAASESRVAGSSSMIRMVGCTSGGKAPCVDFAESQGHGRPVALRESGRDVAHRLVAVRGGGARPPRRREPSRRPPPARLPRTRSEAAIRFTAITPTVGTAGERDAIERSLESDPWVIFSPTGPRPPPTG